MCLGRESGYFAIEAMVVVTCLGGGGSRGSRVILKDARFS